MRIYRFVFLLLLLAACNEGVRNPHWNTDPGDNKRVSGDYAGVYRGVFPCVDCPGRLMEVILDAKGHYRQRSSILGSHQPVSKSSGSYYWNTDGNVVVLETEQGPRQYLVTDTALFLLDMIGNRIGPGKEYLLRKMPR